MRLEVAPATRPLCQPPPNESAVGAEVACSTRTTTGLPHRARACRAIPSDLSQRRAPPLPASACVLVSRDATRTQPTRGPPAFNGHDEHGCTAKPPHNQSNNGKHKSRIHLGPSPGGPPRQMIRAVAWMAYPEGRGRMISRPTLSD